MKMHKKNIDLKAAFKYKLSTKALLCTKWSIIITEMIFSTTR